MVSPERPIVGHCGSLWVTVPPALVGVIAHHYVVQQAVPHSARPRAAAEGSTGTRRRLWRTPTPS